MNIDRWHDIVANIKDNFEVEDSGKSTLKMRVGLMLNILFLLLVRGSLGWNL